MTGAEFTVLDVEQGSPEWFQARLGKATASRASDVLAGTGVLGARNSKNELASRRNYRIDLVLERITGKAQDADFKSVYMEQGNEREAAALAAYEALTGSLVRRTGFVQHLTLEAGCSLDGDLDDMTGIVEAKCPKPATHLETLSTRRVPQTYLAQVTHDMWLTGARWADFLSYCPEFPEELQTCLVRCERLEANIQAYGGELYRFLQECDEEQARVRELQRRAGAQS